MAVRIGINGFGRIGRAVFRIVSERSDMEIVAINDLYDNDQLAYLLKYDTVMGIFDKNLRVQDDAMFVDSSRVAMTAHADPAQIEQVLLNLALNARDAMPDGGLLRMSCKQVGKRVELCVTDTGIGMDDATRLSAFEPFFTTKPRSQGTGLGLALVQGIMEASGGTIQVTSTQGVGTEFMLSWPALELATDDLELTALETIS